MNWQARQDDSNGTKDGRFGAFSMVLLWGELIDFQELRQHFLFLFLTHQRPEDDGRHQVIYPDRSVLVASV